MHAIAHEGCTDIVRASALKADSGRKIPCRTGEFSPCQQRAGLTLCQLSYILAPFFACFACLRKQGYVSPLLTTIHWLPIQAHTEYKLSTLCLSFFCNAAPVYLSDLFHVYCPSRQLRSSSDLKTIRIPHMKTKTFGHRSLSYAPPSVWNSLSCDIRHI